MTASAVEGINVTLHSSFGMSSDAIVAALINRLQTVLGLRSGLSAPYIEAIRILTSRMQLTDAISSARLIALSNTFGVGSTLTESELRLVALIDAIALASGVADTQTVDKVLAIVLGLHESLHTPIIELLTATFGLHSSVADSVEAYASALAAMRLTVTSQGGALLSAAVSDTFFVAANLSDTVEKLIQLASSVGLMFTFSTGDEAYTAWVMDAESKAMWTYDNYPFNSFCQLGDRYLAAGPGGIFELGGTKDDTAEIQWKLRTGLLNFGASTKKRIDRMYLGYTTAGTVGLSVITTAPDGEKVQYNYTMTTHTANVPTNDRMKVGRGLNSVYFAFEFNGTGDFSLSDAKILPMITTRRV